MAIVTPEQMDYSNDNLIMVVSGLPGVGKTTLASSAPDVLIIDLDNGMKRVNVAHRRTVISAATYEELLQDLKSSTVKAAKTLVIDTCGALIELMKDWACKQNGGAKKGGGVSLQGYGIIKTEFNRLFRELRQSHNCVLLFHTLKEKDRDGNPIFDIQCEGATKQTVWQPVDLGGYLEIVGNDRVLRFKPTQEYSAKKCYGVADYYVLPELNESTPNVFLAQLFEQIKANIAQELAAGAEKRKAYDEVMDIGRTIIAQVVDAETAQQATSALNELPQALTSKEELKAAFKGRLAEVEVRWNVKDKRYEAIADDA